MTLKAHTDVDASAACAIRPPWAMRPGRSQPRIRWCEPIRVGLTSCDSGCATFHFQALPDRRRLGADRQSAFVAAFRKALAALETWSHQADWPCSPPADLQIFVSDDCNISKSLVPAWFGQRGRMEFPAARVAAERAALVHELVHVYFPNANRLLAEGLAVHLQAELGAHPAFPDFGRPLHALARDLLKDMLPRFTGANPAALAPLDLAALDRIAVPNPLVLQVGEDLYDEDAHGQARLYPIVGSFIRFLSEAHGIGRLRALYEQTPLDPFVCDSGRPERWSGTYGCSLADLAIEWKWMIAGL